MDIVRRKLLLVTIGTERVNRKTDCLFIVIVPIILMKSSSVFDEIVIFFKRNNSHASNYYSQARSSVPPRFHQCIYYLKVESVGSRGFQIHLCILACVMSREVTCDAGLYKISTSSISLNLM